MPLSKYLDVKWTDIPEYIDIAFVIDASGDMGKHALAVKRFMLEFSDELKRTRCDDGFKVAGVRVKLISFTDFSTDGGNAIRQTEFFRLPDDGDKLDAAFCDLPFAGGGDIPENGWEALHAAVHTDWRLSPEAAFTDERNMHFIVLISNALPLDLHERASEEGYDISAYPSDPEDIESAWRDLHKNDFERAGNFDFILAIVPPESDSDGHSWAPLSLWDNTIVYEFPESLDKDFGIKYFYSELRAKYAPIFGRWDRVRR